MLALREIEINSQIDPRLLQEDSLSARTGRQPQEDLGDELRIYEESS